MLPGRSGKVEACGAEVAWLLAPQLEGKEPGSQQGWAPPDPKFLPPRSYCWQPFLVLCQGRGDLPNSGVRNQIVHFRSEAMFSIE